MQTAIDVIKCEVATLDNVNLREVYALVPAVEKKCKEIKEEVKARINKDGEMEGLKEYEENAGVKVTDLGKFFEAFQDYIDRDQFTAECCTVNLTAFKKVVTPVIQEMKLRQGEKISKQVINATIDNKALEFGEQKTKKSIM